MFNSVHGFPAWRSGATSPRSGKNLSGKIIEARSLQFSRSMEYTYQTIPFSISWGLGKKHSNGENMLVKVVAEDQGTCDLYASHGQKFRTCARS